MRIRPCSWFRLTPTSRWRRYSPTRQRHASRAFFLRELGSGREVYFPGDIDRTFWEVLDADHAKLLRNAVLWATNEAPPVTVEGQGVLDISVWGQKSSMTLHLVNLTNPMMMKGPLREVIPLSNQQVEIRIPVGRRISRVHFLVAGTPAHYRHDGASILLAVRSIGVHEVVAVDFAGEATNAVPHIFS